MSRRLVFCGEGDARVHVRDLALGVTAVSDHLEADVILVPSIRLLGIRLDFFLRFCCRRMFF